ncbi:hypothetical protein [Neomesorhizobium albiziae]|uniref:hypothetical protein n=1 Tax=Neomesorhizobium albiziae TaxID=335020 RepID=UPI00165F79D3|nr:hypothetical protein [Mesorhizobium albiziae]
MADAAIISIEAPSVALRTASCAIEAVNAARLVNRVTLARSARIIILSFVVSICLFYGQRGRGKSSPWDEQFSLTVKNTGQQQQHDHRIWMPDCAQFGICEGKEMVRL